MKFLITIVIICSQVFYSQTNYRVNINNINLPIDNRGHLADVNIPPDGAGGKFDGINFLFSGGFFLTGFNNDTLWGNGVAGGSIVNDYQQGPVGSEPLNPLNQVYVVRNSDTPFGPSWIEYQIAVLQGADFYDGNNDGLYIPVDINGNNLWDLTEDRPDLLGDISAWTVYNDGVPPGNRTWIYQQPLGLEIRQTIFGWGNSDSGTLQNMIFIRYRIINKGTVSDKFDTVYFGSWTDPDIGELVDDKVGSDAQLLMGYAYNDGDDNEFNTNPPAFGIPILQGPVHFVPGETFIDNNSNGIFDFGTDTPLDSARLKNGPILGTKLIIGARNEAPSYFMHYVNEDTVLGSWNNLTKLRNYMKGSTVYGKTIDPCTWPYGEVFGLNCLTTDRRYLYSGNPETFWGWLNTVPSDQRMIISTGPFTLEVNKPIDIIIGFIVGRGTDAENSVTVLKNYTEIAKSFYNSNFSVIPTDINQLPEMVSDFELNQNFPNPFNPTTTISWQSAFAGHQTLKVYDVLGNEVATLVNEFRNAGSYEVDFNASKLSSGVYFYQMTAGNLIQTKKMILIR